jgi:exopolysaccharide biosynthesis polyprenyl glycosylphosphotransferase
MTTQANTFKVTSTPSLVINSQWTSRLLLLALLVATDLLTILVGFWLAYLIRFEAGISWWAYQHETSPIDFYQGFVFLFAPLWVVVFGLFGLYEFKNIFSGMREYAKVFNGCTLGMMLIILFTFFDPSFIIARGWVILSWLLVSSSVGAGRFMFRRIVFQMRTKGYFLTRVLVIGANEEGRAIAQQLRATPKTGVRVVGFLDNVPQTSDNSSEELPVIGSIDSVISMIAQYDIQEVIIASTALTRENLLDLFQLLGGAEIPTRLSSGIYELITTGLEVQEVGHVPLLSINKVRLTGMDMILKRLLDLAGAAAALIVFLPLMVIIGIAIKLDSSGPIFYRRRVVGVSGRLFDAFKFRTMCVDADERLARDAALRNQFEKNYKLKDDPRVTRVGQFLRRTSLDELPQLFNVLLGQMSLVGPRMITSPERIQYGKWSMNLSTVKPGMTGLWQVSGRSNVSYEERVRLDMHYIRNYTIWLDLYLLWLTIPAVLKSRGAF